MLRSRAWPPNSPGSHAERATPWVPAAGVTGGGFIALAATLPVVDAVPVAGLALLLGVDRFTAEIRAATKLTSNIIATLVVGRWVGGVDIKIATAELRAGFVETEETLVSDKGHK